MAIDRPTFSESWYRVAGLRPQLRPTVQTWRQHYRGELWQVVQDPTNNQFFRLDEPGYYFVALLDGKRTVAEAWELAQEQLGDEAPTQGEAIQLLGQLYSSNLLRGDLPADAENLLRRYRKRVRREVGSYFKNLLFVRVPLFDPDRILSGLIKPLAWLFGPVGMALWVILIGVGGLHLLGHGARLWDQTAGILAPSNLPWLYVCLVVVKAIHEMGHGLACKRFGRREGGGEVHTLGIMFLVFVPVPYVDASSSWAFRSKWHRAFVGAAGMYTELAVAAIAAVVWVRTAEDSIVHALAYNTIFIASVSTLLFNGNPLLRFDGYYILSDLVEMPNLFKRSRDYIYYIVKRYAYGVRRPVQPAHTGGEKAWLATYGVTSFIYRVFICVTILLFVADKLFFVGAMLAVMAVVTWVVVPLGKWGKYLVNNPELERTRTRAISVTASAFGVVLGPLLVIPLPEHGRAQGVVEPLHFAEIHADVDGWLTDVLDSGTEVAPNGLTLISAENPMLEARRERLEAALTLAEIQQHAARPEELAVARSLAERHEAMQRRLERAEHEVRRLELTSPVPGQWLTPLDRQRQGAFVRRGQKIGMVASLDELVIRAIADQHLGPHIRTDRPVQMRIIGQPDLELTGDVHEPAPAGQRVLPSAALGYAAGGAIAIDPNDPEGRHAASAFFEVRVTPHQPHPRLLVGQRVVLRFELGHAPLAMQWGRKLRQLIQRRFDI